MNAADILKYGHLTVCRSIDGLPDSDWQVGGVCGVWSVRDIIGHLAAYEHVLTEVLRGFLAGGQTPHLEAFQQDPLAFNDDQAALRRDRSVQDVLAEYSDAHARNMALLPQLPPETWVRPGALPWYGPEYALDDFVVYQYYGHKREHCAQIDLYRDRLRRGGPPPQD